MPERYDLRLDVPVRAFINASLQTLLEKGGTFFDAKRHFFSQGSWRRQGLSEYEYSFCDHAQAIGLLFCTIVVPKEFLDLPPNHMMYADFDARNILGIFSEVSPVGLDSYAFLRRLRNCVAHSDFAICESGGEAHYTFGADGNSPFKARIGHKKLMEFIEVVGVPLTDAVLKKKPGA